MHRFRESRLLLDGVCQETNVAEEKPVQLAESAWSLDCGKLNVSVSRHCLEKLNSRILTSGPCSERFRDACDGGGSPEAILIWTHTDTGRARQPTVLLMMHVHSETADAGPE